MYYIGVDLGTSAVKLILMAEDGSLRNIQSCEYPLFFPENGWSEQNPADWWNAVVKGIHTVAEFEKIGKWIAGCPAYYLQNYEENENCLYRMIQTAECDDVKPGGVDPFGAFSKEELEQMEELARKYVGKVVLRGVE